MGFLPRPTSITNHTIHQMSLQTLLATVPASRFIASSPVFSVESSTSLRDAVRVLHENKVTGAPVVVDEVTSVRRLVDTLGLLLLLQSLHPGVVAPPVAASMLLLQFCIQQAI